MNRSDKVRDALFNVLDQQFQVPRRIDPANAAVAVSGATYSGDALAPESIISIFGSQLADASAQANEVPLPTRLGGTSIDVRDAAGNVRPMGLFYTSANQINAALPAGLANGLATFTLRTSSGVVRQGAINVGAISPGLFTANASGTGVAAGYITRVRPGAPQTTEPLAEFDTAQSRMVARAFDMGPAGDQVYLILFGTGLRNRSDLAKVVVQVGGVAHPVQYVGAQGMVGLDQINILLSRDLAGRGEIDVRMTVDGVATNTTRIAVK